MNKRLQLNGQVSLVKICIIGAAQVITIQTAIAEMNTKTCLRIEPKSAALAKEAGHNGYIRVISDR